MKKFSIISAAIIGLYSAPLAISEGSDNNSLKDFEDSMVMVSKETITLEDFEDSMVDVSKIAMTASEEKNFQKHLLAQDQASANQGIYSIMNDFVEMPGDEDQGHKDPSFKRHLLTQDQAFADQQAYNNSWSKYAKDTAISGVKYAGGTACALAKTSAAWSLNYYSVEALEKAVAYGAYGAGYIASYGNPVVGNAAYYTTKAAIKAARYIIPGFEGYLAGTFAPMTKALIVDPVVNLTVNYGPSVVKGVAKGTIATAKLGYTGAKMAANGTMTAAKVGYSAAKSSYNGATAVFNGFSSLYNYYRS